MDAVIENIYTIYYGGSYEEHWTPDYRLTVSYGPRQSLAARREDEGWCFSPPLPSLPLASEYFTAAADVAASMELCDALDMDRRTLYEVFHSDSPAAPFELLRALLDDWAFEFEAAVALTVRCCPDADFSIDFDALCKLQPRTAHLISILDTALHMRIIAIHDSRKVDYRRPLGAVVTGQAAALSFRDAGGNISSARCLLYGDSFQREYPMEKSGGRFTVDIMLPNAPAALWYCFCLDTEHGEKWLCPDGSGFYGLVIDNREPGFRLTVYARDFKTPDWFKSAVMYQIFPDRFAFSGDGTAEKGVEYHLALGQTPELHKSADEPVRWQPRSFEAAYEPDDFYGGTLKGIESRLEYLSSLGVTVIYLNPIVEARSNHRYDTSDYMKVDPVLGTNEDFARLCAAAKSSGIRIITDGVFSHTGADSVYFNRFGRYPGKGACQGPDSPYYKWYSFDCSPGGYKCWWNFPDLPEVDEENSLWQDYVVTGENSVVKTWLGRGGSGWRIDVADELPDDVLERIRAAAKAEKPDAVIIGEVWEDAVTKESYGHRRGYALGSALDSVMNYPLRTAVLDFLHRRTDAFELRDFLDTQRLNYPRPLYYSLMNLMGSHDVERLRTNLAADVDVRSLSKARQSDFAPTAEGLARAVKLERLAAAIQFSLPGVPDIYYGEETGMTGCGDPFNRLPFRDGDKIPVEFYKKLAEIRAAHYVMSTGDAEFSALGGDVLLIRRYCGTEEIISVINRGAQARPVFLNKPGRELFSGERIASQFMAPPFAAIIIKTE